MRKSAEPLTPAFSVIPFDLENAPKLERKADPPKKKAPKVEAAPAQAVASSSAAPAPEKESKKVDKAPAQPAQEGAEGAKTQKKEKKEKKPAEESSKKGKPAAEDAGEPVPSMIDLRVGHIVDSRCRGGVYHGTGSERVFNSAVMKHPDADGLYVEVSFRSGPVISDRLWCVSFVF